MPPVKPDYPHPGGVPKDYQEHIRLMVLANEGSNESYPFIEVPDGHHNLSHHGNDKAKIAKINKFHVEQLAYLLDKLKNTPEAGGSLLDHCMIGDGSGNSDGNRHNHDDLPILVAGHGCGTLKPGRHLRFPKETPLNNLWTSLLGRMEVDVAELGDSTGALKNLGA